jgi:hypothetical protein
MGSCQTEVKKIAIERISNEVNLMITPAGVTEKRFRATIQNFEKSGATLILDIEIKDKFEKNGNRISVERLALEGSARSKFGITSELLRKVAVQKLAEICVTESVNKFYPESIRHQSLKVAADSDMSRVEEIAYVSRQLGVKPPVKKIQEKLNEQGVSLKEGTIRNYLTKASKAGLLEIEKFEDQKLPKNIAELNPNSLMNEADLVLAIIKSSNKKNTPRVSPIQVRELAKKNKQLEASRLERERLIRLKKRKSDLEKRNAPLKTDKPKGR